MKQLISKTMRNNLEYFQKNGIKVGPDSYLIYLPMKNKENDRYIVYSLNFAHCLVNPENGNNDPRIQRALRKMKLRKLLT